MYKSEKNMSAKKQYAAPALEKGLDMLELLASEPEGLNVAQITEKLERSYGELFRMLMVLEQRGYVESQSHSDRYQLSLKMFSLANNYPPVKRITSVAAPILKKLAFTIEQSCHLVTMFDGRGRVIAQQDSPSSRNFGVKLGAEAPLMNTCSGHVLMSFASEEELNLMLSKIPAGDPKPKKGGFKDMSQKIRADGFEAMKSRQLQGVFDIGYPVFDNSGDVTAALVVPFLEFIDDSHPVTFEEAKPLILKASQEMSKQLGYS